MTSDRDQLIRDRAYGIWQAEGCPSGRAADHWRQAAQEIDEVMAASQAAVEAPAPKRARKPKATALEPAPTPTPAPRGRRKKAD